MILIIKPNLVLAPGEVSSIDPSFIVNSFILYGDGTSVGESLVNI